MASPIEATPVLRGDDAQRLIDSLGDMCSPEEAKRRIAWSKDALAEMARREIAWDMKSAITGQVEHTTFYPRTLVVGGHRIKIVFNEDGRIGTRSRGLVVWHRPASIDDVRTRHHGVNCSSDTLPESLAPQPTPAAQCCRGWIGHTLGRCTCVR